MSTYNDGDEASPDLFSGPTGNKKKSTASGDAGEISLEQLREVGRRISAGLVAPGQMSMDEAKRYHVRIKNLFPSVSQAEFELALFTWGCTQGTGGATDYANAEPLVIGDVSVPATRFAGEIVPVDSRGLLRKYFSTMFESKALIYMDAVPNLRDALAARAAKAGDPGGDPYNHIDFVKGVSAASKGSAAVRVVGKDRLLGRRSGGTPGQAQPEVSFADSNGVSGGLYG